MREFSILIQPHKKTGFQGEKYSLKVLTNFPGSSQIPELEQVKEGKLKLVSETKEFRQFRIDIDYYRKKSGIGDKSYLEHGKFDVWQHKGGFCVSIDSSRAISKVAAAFLSVVQFGELRAVRLLEMDLNRYIALVRHANEFGGGVNMLHLKNVESENLRFSVFAAHGKDVGKMNVDQMLKSAKKIKRVGFFIPDLVNEYYSFWVADWGGGAIYSPRELLPHQIAGLLEFFEKALIPSKSKQ